jgi:ketosteroid isomerase-like protein
VEDRFEAAREVMRQTVSRGGWEDALDPAMPPDLAELTEGIVEAYRQGDLDWLLEHTHPEVVIAQVPELPDGRSYTGRDGMVDALLDWPRQWEDFRVVPQRVFAPDDEHIVVMAVHGGRPRSMDIEVEAEIVFVFHVPDGLVARWDMYLTLDEALSRASQSRADRDDDRAAQRHGGERA